MLERVTDLDTMGEMGATDGTRRTPPRRRGDGPGEGRSANAIGLRHTAQRNRWDSLGSREVEGQGGRFWYEWGE